MRERHVLLHAHGRDQARSLAVLGNHGDAPRDPFANVGAGELTAVEANAAAHVRVEAEQALHQFSAPRAHEAVEAQNLSRANVEGHVAETGSAWCRRQLQILDGENRRSRRPPAMRGGRGSVSAGHSPHDPRDIDVGTRRMTDHETVAQHGHVIGHRQQLLEPVRDIDDADAVCGQVANHVEEHRYLGRRERRGGLVHHQHARFMDDRAGNLHDLLLPERQRADAPVDRQMLTEPLERRGRRRASGPRDRWSPIV